MKLLRFLIINFLQILVHFSPGIFSVKEDSNDIKYAMNWANKIVELRESKIPNTSDYPNVGSFFKNPLVSEKFFQNNKKLEKLKTFKREEIK